ncbi:MAG: alkaline shock response membrane anchor protein AmaP [Clostridiales bacterium]|nr:alkaline shock response membrane anchor protein AmaP [Clostridiales bacterium]
MKILERIALIIFSIIMLIVSIVLCLVVFNVVELQTIFEYSQKIVENQIGERIILGVSIVSILLAIKALFFPTRRAKKQEIKTGILLENKDGRLLISRDTIENMVNSVVNSFKEVKEVQTKIILNDDNNITVFITLLVDENAVIKDLSVNIQNKIKDTVKKSTDLDINQVNINIKNINNTGIEVEGHKNVQYKNVAEKQNNVQFKNNSEIHNNMQYKKDIEQKNNISINDNKIENKENNNISNNENNNINEGGK